MSRMSCINSTDLPRAGNRIAMTLLEVLVALGILAAGLASVAALMPAAGARVAEANFIDRAGALAANVHEDIRSRITLTATTLFPTTATLAVVSGTMFQDSVFSTTPFRTIPSLIVADQVFNDDLQLELSGTAVTEKTGGLCHGLTIVPTISSTTPVTAGLPARLSVITFKRPSVETSQLTLTRRALGVFQLNGPATDAEANRKRFLGNCSWVMVSSTSAPERPAWLRVTSSWVTSGTAAGSFVSFADADTVQKFVSASNTLTVQGFTRLLRVDERVVILK